MNIIVHHGGLCCIYGPIKKQCLFTSNTFHYNHWDSNILSIINEFINTYRKNKFRLVVCCWGFVFVFYNFTISNLVAVNNYTQINTMYKSEKQYFGIY